MEINVLQVIILIGGLSAVGLIIARYSVTAVFTTMHYFMERLQSRNQK